MTRPGEPDNLPRQPPKGGTSAEPLGLDMVMAELKRIAKPAWGKRVGIAGAQMWGIFCARSPADRQPAGHRSMLGPGSLVDRGPRGWHPGHPRGRPGGHAGAGAGWLGSWDLTDAFTGNLVARSGHAWAKATERAARKKPSEKRAAFSLMAALAAQDKAADHEALKRLLPLL